MTLAVFNINDAGIQLALDGVLVRTSPGYAVLNNGQLMTGEDASKNARLLPRWTNNRFWGDLSTRPIANATDGVRHHADLAFAHLEDLWSTIAKDAREAIFIVPGFYDNEQLGLLLGMARECRIPVCGMVDASIAVAANLPLRSHVLHLDIHLHSITLTRLSNAGTLVRREVKTVMETGLFTFWDRWANIIANQFIQSTRFDPLHNASSEQQLFNQLPEWITALGDRNMHPFQLEVDGTGHSIAISNENLLKACAPLYPQIIQAIRAEIPTSETASLLLSHRFAGFPGLKNSLDLIENIDVIDLGELKAIGSASLHRDEIVGNGSGINHTVSLSAGAADEAPARRQASIPSHLLWNHGAYPVGDGIKLEVSESEGPHRSSTPQITIYTRNNSMLADISEAANVLVNGAPVTGSIELKIGDQLTVNGQQLTLISVIADG
ncbi:MAG: hypothetical protein O3B72_08660 [Proteobacteria bacterium]|nr:hypothetical protein [Pseudomonadota bacterium]